MRALQAWSAVSLALCVVCGLAVGADSPSALVEIRTHVKRHEYGEALCLLDEALWKHPADAAAVRCRGFVRLMVGDPERAKQDFTAALRLRPQDAVLFYGRGAAHRLLGQYKECLADLARALELDPGYSAARWARFQVLGETGDYSGACRELSEGEISEPGLEDADFATSPRIELEYFVVYKAWLEVFRQHRRTKVSGYRAGDARGDALRLAWSQAAGGELVKAIERISEIVRQFPKDWQLHRTRGILHIAAARFSAAVADLSVAIELRPNDFDLYEWRADVFYELGEEGRGAADTLRAAKLQEKALRAQERARIR